jgi:hypothetical protein
MDEYLKVQKSYTEWSRVLEIVTESGLESLGSAPP